MREFFPIVSIPIVSLQLGPDPSRLFTLKPTTIVAKTSAPDGAVFALYRHDGQFFLYMNDRQVMSTTLTHSELLLADIGCGSAGSRKSPRVLIGGLGLGYSLRRTLELTGSGATIVVAELLPEIERWNRELLDGLNDGILADARTEIVHADVHELIRVAGDPGPRYDAILLDVDDGPSSLLQPHNARIYGRAGLEMLRGALCPRGRAAIWAAVPEPRLLKGLNRAGFRTEEIPCAKHPRAKRQSHRIYLAERKD